AGGAPQPERCGRADPLDDHALLAAALGLRSGSPRAAPLLAITFPPPLPVLPMRFPVELDASDDVAVRRLEIYRDLELIAVVEAPPFRAELTLAEASATTLT